MKRYSAALMAFALLFAAQAEAQALQPVTVVQGLEHPWGLAFLPDFDGKAGRMLVTERPGRLRLATAGGALGPPMAGVPEVDARGQGGLLDVVLDPKFADNGFIYLSYAEAGDGGNGTAVGRARLETRGLQGRLVDWQVIYRQRPKVQSTLHFGSRLVFSRDGSKLFVTLGERNSRREEAQNPRTDLGKVMRLAPDGSNAAELWSIGHRNVQGAALHPATGALWTHEHGPQGGDEVNIVEAGRNYGWPVVTYGVEYFTGRKIGEGTSKPGMEPPLWHWVPSIAPSGMAFLTSDRYGAAWKGSLFVGALKSEMLVRLQLDGNRVVGEQRLLQGQVGRVRDVRQGPDGWLYLLTDEDQGRIVRVELAPAR
ncbi:MAG TPA: PQQ-dependent sugar dehydrogenase [Burkholderiaceae bacterium]|nr:PQQ-dependent sugar dehydrogenase [Burkholderiaceae bacterium]